MKCDSHAMFYIFHRRVKYINDGDAVMSMIKYGLVKWASTVFVDVGKREGNLWGVYSA